MNQTISTVEAARVLGEKLWMESNGDVPKMIKSGFLKCLGRQPDARELGICRELFEEQKNFFMAKPEIAANLLKNSNSASSDKIPVPEAAAATVLAQVLLNHDECVVKR